MESDTKLLSRCITETNDCLLIAITVQPGAKTSEIEGIDPFRGTLGVKVKSLAQKGKANQELINLLSSKLDVPQFNINIVKGEKSRQKTVKIINYNKTEFVNKLNSIVQ